MTDNPRIDELKRRVQQDPASIAFAALADEYRRAGLFHEAVETCRAGLQRHPAYMSARVTLGRSLVELGEFDEAHRDSSRCSQRPGEPGGHPCARGYPSPTGSHSSRQSRLRPPPSLPRKLRPSLRQRPLLRRRLSFRQSPSPSRFPPFDQFRSLRPSRLRRQRHRHRAPLKPLTLSADSHQSIALVTLASEPDAEEPEIADLVPTMADAQLPVIRELEQLLAGIDRARQAIDALSA